jgi:beta-glucosidase
MFLTAVSERLRGRLRLAVSALLMLGAAGPALPQPTGEAHPALWPQAQSSGLIDPGTEAAVSALMAQMSVEEKVGQMIQADIASIKPEDLREVPLGSILAGGNSPPLGAGVRAGLPAWVATARAFRAVALEQRPGHVPIPLIFGIDAVHGNSRVVGATLFPHNVGLGAAHDPGLMARIGAATAQETAAAGIDWAFGPTLAVPQDERWGRAYEGYSSNPNLVSLYADAVVRGLQGEPGSGALVQHGHVAASAKHFLADGGTAGGVDQGDATIGEAELIRLHAPAYPVAIEAGAMTVMASFSSWQGIKNHANRSLLTGVLKERFGFQGFVVGDWNAHGQVPGCTNENCPAAINAGIDMVMTPDSWKGFYRNLLDQVRSGAVPMQRIDDAVRRILRVKMRLGLFDPARPWEGRAEAVGSPEHRQLAREAVRKSLVLLKNNGQVLPLKAGAHVLVAGAGADDIGMQCGGWTLSWQGTGNSNADFPGAHSLYAGLREALAAGGGSAELSADGRYTGRPDAAVVVFGETPYAEGWGDLKTLEFDSGDNRELALMRQLHAEGIPVVAVFLSGRPLWVNPAINAADAFVAAWLPGSEGEGVADLLIGDAAGQPRYPFTGRLGYAWPNTAAHAPAADSAAVLFPRGYGLASTATAKLARLGEDPGVRAARTNFSDYMVRGRPLPPWSLQLQSGGKTLPLAAAQTTASLDGALSIRAVDAAGTQEGGRQLSWSGTAPAAFAIAGPQLDMRMLANGDASLTLDIRVDQKPSAPAQLAVACGPGCGAALDLGPILRASPVGEWRTLKVKLSCFRNAGANVAQITEPLVLGTGGPLRLSLSTVQLSSDPAGAVCPAAAQPP